MTKSSLYFVVRKYLKTTMKKTQNTSLCLVVRKVLENYHEKNGSIGRTTFLNEGKNSH